MPPSAQEPIFRRFTGRVVLVTGGAAGIGAATAARFALEGARVVVLDVDAAAGGNTVDRISEQGGEAVLVVGDTAIEVDAKRAVSEIEERWGRLDVVVNNAGVPPPDVPIEEVTIDQWKAQFHELVGCFLVSKHSVRLMKLQGGETRSIAFVASMAALKGVALRSPYTAMKHGVLGLSRSLAIELAPHRIRVNCVATGPVDTTFLSRGAPELPRDRREMFENGVPLGRIGVPDDIASIVTHLASDESTWITGNVIRMAGGTPAG